MNLNLKHVLLRYRDFYMYICSKELVKNLKINSCQGHQNFNETINLQILTKI